MSGTVSRYECGCLEGKCNCNNQGKVQPSSQDTFQTMNAGHDITEGTDYNNLTNASPLPPDPDALQRQASGKVIGTRSGSQKGRFTLVPVEIDALQSQEKGIQNNGLQSTFIFREQQVSESSSVCQSSLPSVYTDSSQNSEHKQHQQNTDYSHELRDDMNRHGVLVQGDNMPAINSNVTLSQNSYDVSDIDQPDTLEDGAILKQKYSQFKSQDDDNSLPSTPGRTMIAGSSATIPVISVNQQPLQNSVLDQIGDTHAPPVILTQFPMTQTTYVTHPAQDLTTYIAPATALTAVSPATIVGMVGNTPILRMQGTTGLVRKRKGRFKFLQSTTEGDPNNGSNNNNNNNNNIATAPPTLAYEVASADNNMTVPNDATTSLSVENTPVIAVVDDLTAVSVDSQNNQVFTQTKRKGRFVITSIRNELDVPAAAHVTNIVDRSRAEDIDKDKADDNQSSNGKAVSTSAFMVTPTHIVSSPIVCARETINNHSPTQTKPEPVNVDTSHPQGTAQHSVTQQNEDATSQSQGTRPDLGRPPKAPNTKSLASQSQDSTTTLNLERVASELPIGGPPSGNDASESIRETLSGDDGKDRNESKSKVSQASKARKFSSTPNSMRQNAVSINGQGGLGKVFYFLDQMRSEVTEADRTMKTLQIDMKCLKEKNKELEARARDFERKYQQEKFMRESAELKIKSLKKKLRILKSGSTGDAKKTDDSIQENVDSAPVPQELDSNQHNVEEVRSVLPQDNVGRVSGQNGSEMLSPNESENYKTSEPSNSSHFSNSTRSNHEVKNAENKDIVSVGQRADLQLETPTLRRSSSSQSEQYGYNQDVLDFSYQLNGVDNTAAQSSNYKHTEIEFDPLKCSNGEWLQNQPYVDTSKNQQTDPRSMEQNAGSVSLTPLYMMDMNNASSVVPIYGLEANNLQPLVQFTASNASDFSTGYSNTLQTQTTTTDIQQPMFFLSQQPLTATIQNESDQPSTLVTLQQPLLQLQDTNGSATYTFHSSDYASSSPFGSITSNPVGFYTQQVVTSTDGQVDLISSEVFLSNAIQTSMPSSYNSNHSSNNNSFSETTSNSDCDPFATLLPKSS